MDCSVRSPLLVGSSSSWEYFLGISVTSFINVLLH